MADACTHLDNVADVIPSSEGCEDCPTPNRRPGDGLTTRGVALIRD